MAGRARRADIQGLRGLAVLLVVAYHAGLHVPGGFIGVDVFFAISGFVITGLLLPELSAGGSIDLRRFYIRRARRLLPALALMLVAVATAGVLDDPINAQRRAALTGIAASVFAANAYLWRLGTGYFDVAASLNPLVHTWTLAVEEQFYLVFPALLLVSWRLGSRRPRIAAVAAVGAVSVGSFALAIALTGGSGFGSRQRFAFYGSPTRAWEFGAGAVLALGAQLLPRLRSGPSELLGLGGMVAIVAGAFLIHGTAGYPGWSTLVPVGGACALLAVGAAHDTLASRALAVRPMTWLGDLSYSWYLWHWPTIVFARALFPGKPVGAAAAALSLGFAWLSYRYVENPIRHDPRWQGRSMLALAAVCIAVPIAASGALLGVQDLLLRTTPIAHWWKPQTHADLARGCESTVPLGQRTGPRWAPCTWTVPHARGRIVLVGDSNAGHFTEPVVAAGNRAGFDVSVAPLAGCPFVALRIVGSSVDEPTCRRFDGASLAALVRQSPSLVVIANRDDLMINTTSKGFGALGGGRVQYGAEAKARLWERGLAAVLGRLGRAGIPVLLVRPVPPIPSLPSGCAVLLVLASSCVGSISREEVAAIRRRAIVAENRAAAAAPSVSLLDLENELCGRARCSSVRRGTVTYIDVDHLSVAGSRTLTGAFNRAIVLHAR